MKGSYLQVAAGIGIAAALFLGGFFMAGLWFNPPTASGDLATWTGALGAFLAFAGTIWVATSEARHRSRDELLKARLHAASMVLRFVHAQSVIADVCRELDLSSKVDRGIDPFARCASKLAGIDAWTIHELIPLAPLPNSLAVQLAEAADQIKTAIKVLEKTQDKKEFAESEARLSFASGFHKLLVKTCDMVGRSIVECRKAAETLHLNAE